VVGVSDPVDEWRSDLAAAGELTASVVERIVALHGGRGRRAIEAVSEQRVKGYRDFTVVVGHEDEYVVEGRGCACKDAAYNLDADDPTQLCWHALAVEIAEAIDAVDHHDMWYSEVREFL
jgi:predicted nucleic acid-binding Zn finger protein